jgi:hypothetical protein
MSDLPIVAWRREWDGDVSELGSWVYVEEGNQLDHVGIWQPLTDHAAATASLSSAQQRIEELSARVERLKALDDEVQDLWGADQERLKAAQQRIEELERALGAEVTPCRGLLDSKCKYLTHCGALCKKCGRQHDGQPAPNPGLAAAVLDFLRAVDDRHDSNHAPLKYTVPWGAVNALRAAVGTSPGVARGIVSPEGIETGTGSTAQPPEPGPAGGAPRPSKGFSQRGEPTSNMALRTRQQGDEVMAERGILFSAPMVRAILAGTKTQTRRVVKPQPERDHRGVMMWPLGPHRRIGFEGKDVHPDLHEYCPYGVPGDRLWVREAWRAPSCIDDLMPSEIPAGYSISFTANGGQQYNGRPRPGMFMPRWASRITLEVTGVRVERLQDIRDDEAIAEGCTGDGLIDPSEEYAALWDSINGRGAWATNPWVWCVSFRRLASKSSEP